MHHTQMHTQILTNKTHTHNQQSLNLYYFVDILPNTQQHYGFNINNIMRKHRH